MNKISNNQKGGVLVLVAVFLPVILFFLAMVINLGTMYYVKAVYFDIATTAAAGGISFVGDKMVEIINNKINATSPYIPVSSNVWDNLGDEERSYLTNNDDFISDVQSVTEEYLQKNIETMMRNDFIINNLLIEYPYNYHLGDNYIKLHLNFMVKMPVVMMIGWESKGVLIEAESQIRIK